MICAGSAAWGPGLFGLIQVVAVALATLVPPMRLSGGVPVLCYHRVYRGVRSPAHDRFGVSTHALEEHLAAIADSGRRVVSLEQLASAAPGAVLLTFDDNWSSHLTCTLPLLRAAGIRGTFYISPAALGSPGRLTRQDVDRLAHAGMSVGAHGNHHILAARLEPEAFVREVRTCRAFLRELGMPLTWAYPGGHIGSFQGIHERILLDHGFTVRFTTVEGLCRPSPERAQPRYVIRRNSSSRYVRAALEGGLQVMTLGKWVGAVVKGMAAPRLRT